MKITYPDYYEKFTCIADKCPDTCCNGWDVVIDSESFAKYSALSGDYGDKIRSLITVDEDGDRIFRADNGRCPFLLQNGLCDMYINLGSDSLCRTCKAFPRFTNCFGARAETGLSLSCPEAARLIFEKSDPAGFVTKESDGEIMPADFDAELYFTLLEARKKAIDILQQRNFSIAQRICSFLEYSQAVQQCIKNGDCSAVKELDSSLFSGKNTVSSSARAKRALNKISCDFASLEFINPDFGNGLSKALSTDTSFDNAPDREYEHLAVYFVYRYFITAAYDGDVLTKAKFTAVCLIALNRLFASQKADTKAKRTLISQKFSKETEHSADNMYFLLESMRKSRYYSKENLINIIQGE